MFEFHLFPHPDPHPSISGLEVRGHLKIDWPHLNVHWFLQGNLDSILEIKDFAPQRFSPETLRRGTQLWQKTCFEVFIKRDPHAFQYWELNISPLGLWDAQAFVTYREPEEPSHKPCLYSMEVLKPHASRFEIRGIVALNNLSPPFPRLWIKPCAVLKSSESQISYWSTAHPPGNPDFHASVGFISENFF
jgi:hypothetical protein